MTFAAGSKELTRDSSSSTFQGLAPALEKSRVLRFFIMYMNRYGGAQIEAVGAEGRLIGKKTYSVLQGEVAANSNRLSNPTPYIRELCDNYMLCYVPWLLLLVGMPPIPFMFQWSPRSRLSAPLGRDFEFLPILFILRQMRSSREHLADFPTCFLPNGDFWSFEVWLIFSNFPFETHTRTHPRITDKTFANHPKLWFSKFLSV